LDLLALIAVVMPRAWIAYGHGATGLGALPPEPIVGYLVRSASLLYALHGAMVVYLSFDVARYWRLITFLAVAALVHGTILVGVDAAEGMPAWWRWAEGPCFAATGAVVLWLQWRAGEPKAEAPGSPGR
jgi:hypothetical protein